MIGTILWMAASVSYAADVSKNLPVSSSSRLFHKSRGHHAKSTRKPRPRGQQAIDGGRARQIQEALVREHYLSGLPSGVWDSTTQEAMRRYQQAQGWQSKTVPDSRALIRLGLGPDHEHLLNPESAMTMGPELPHLESKPQAAQGATSTPFSPATGTAKPVSSEAGASAVRPR
ncbi:MAG: peptidoglycan-binding protein [Acidobacteria bacterium]|nr:peptidoglycan-binding protein [Acidobacteriota bacterium]